MADSKVSELTSATSLGGADVFYVVQSNTSKKITAAKVFENITDVTLKGNVTFDSSVQVITSAGDRIDLKKPVTQLVSNASGGTISIPTGLPNQIKYVVMTSNSGGTITISGNIANSQNISFNAVGKTAQLLFTNNKWYMVGGTATIS